ncbi:hypothetical protein DFJ74DRAFT_765707 [Hyaloraphidium curvatum]|nr:hypothetical protein DFJ74DRAFT_765707 [Hyaloraphidium curvatum]
MPAKGPDAGVPLLHSWLQLTRGSGRPGWRWCALREAGTLAFGEDKARPDTELDIKGATVAGSGRQIEVAAGGESLTLRCATEPEADAWRAALAKFADGIPGKGADPVAKDADKEDTHSEGRDGTADETASMEHRPANKHQPPPKRPPRPPPKPAHLGDEDHEPPAPEVAHPAPRKPAPILTLDTAAAPEEPASAPAAPPSPRALSPPPPSPRKPNYAPPPPPQRSASPAPALPPRSPSPVPAPPARQPSPAPNLTIQTDPTPPPIVAPTPVAPPAAARTPTEPAPDADVQLLSGMKLKPVSPAPPEEPWHFGKHLRKLSESVVEGAGEMGEMISRAISPRPELEQAAAADEPDYSRYVGRTVKVVKPHTAGKASELTVCAGEKVTVLAVTETRWAKGASTETGNMGYFPLVCLAYVGKEEVADAGAANGVGKADGAA